jgi:hypothetical protein
MVNMGPGSPLRPSSGRGPSAAHRIVSRLCLTEGLCMSEITDRMRRLAASPDFIPGIHNYCDRWCERCAMTACCSVFALQTDEASSSGPGQGEDLIGQLGEILESAVIMLHEMAEEMGVDLEEETDDGDADLRRDAAHDHILVHGAVKYAEAVRDWFACRQTRLVEIGALPGPENRPDLHLVGPRSPAGDLAQILLWYSPLIHAKLYRAVIGDEPVAGLEDLPRDADGSAKVALIAIERSVAAWSGLTGHLPEAEGEILAFLRQLERLRRATEWSFPAARAFVRPGFDDPCVPD